MKHKCSKPTRKHISKCCLLFYQFFFRNQREFATTSTKISHWYISKARRTTVSKRTLPCRDFLVQHSHERFRLAYIQFKRRCLMVTFKYDTLRSMSVMLERV